MFELRFDTNAGHTLEKLPSELAERIFSKLQEAREDPMRYFVRLTGRSDYKLRIGDYRVIADIDRSEQTIAITTISHRKHAYRTRYDFRVVDTARAQERLLAHLRKKHRTAMDRAYERYEQTITYDEQGPSQNVLHASFSRPGEQPLGGSIHE